MTSLLSAIVGADVLVCCGPGGVGKTTVSATIALAEAAAGRRVCVLTVDPARRLADALGIDIRTRDKIVDHRLRVALRVRRRIDLVHAQGPALARPLQP